MTFVVEAADEKQAAEAGWSLAYRMVCDHGTPPGTLHLVSVKEVRP